MPRTVWAAERMVRLTQENLDILRRLQQDGESDAATLVRALLFMAEARSPGFETVLIHHRRPPRFPGWLTIGPLTPEDADARIVALQRAGWEVRTEIVAPRVPPEPEPEEPDEEEEPPGPPIVFYANDSHIRREPTQRGS